MTYVHITADTIDALGNPPDLEWDGTRWWDLRDPTIRQARGWHEVAETPRPEPVEGGVHESSVALVDGLPVRVWTWRAWTAEEIAWQAEAEARLDDHGQRLARIEAHLWPAPPDPTTPTDAPEWTEGFVWPIGGLLREGEVVYRNVSGVPLTERPSMFPGSISQWGHLFVVVLAPTTPVPDPDPQYPQWRGEWSATADYLVGDHVTRGGVVYRCLVAHGAAYAGTWGPPTTGVWVVATAT